MVEGSSQLADEIEGPQANQKSPYWVTTEHGFRIYFDLDAVLQAQFPQQFGIVREATDMSRTVVEGRRFAALASNSPGLDTFDWDNYLKLSSIRLGYVLDGLQRHVPSGSSVLDFGSYFGNFAIGAAKAGYVVHAYDAYSNYAPDLDQSQQLISESGATIIDSSKEPDYLSRCNGLYDAVIFCGVIEHIPHTPRELLQTLHRCLRPGGVLLLDTPNLAYIYQRQKLNDGISPMLPISIQFGSRVPFEGHHREYTRDEISWMLNAVGLDIIQTEMFNYSLYGLEYISGRDLENFVKMANEPDMREVIFTAARKRMA